MGYVVCKRGGTPIQILEKSMFGLRSARIQLSGSASRIVILFPMVHVGDGAFCRDVYTDAFSGHDLALVEGVRSPIVRRITRSYRWIIGNRRISYILQPPYPAQVEARARIVHADISAAEFAGQWGRVPVAWRIAVFLLAPLIGLRRRWLETQDGLIAGLEMDDLPGRAELIRWSPEEAALTNAILSYRDQRLIHAIDQALSEEVGSIAIVYGATHMRAVLRHLIGDRGFRVVDTRWLTAMSV